MNNPYSEILRLTEKLESNDLVKLEYIGSNNNVISLDGVCCPHPVIGYELWLRNDMTTSIFFDRIISMNCESKGIRYNVNNNNELEVIF